jgi:hypothetical protein
MAPLSSISTDAVSVEVQSAATGEYRLVGSSASQFVSRGVSAAR